jgi:hypothetical protein
VKVAVPVGVARELQAGAAVAAGLDGVGTPIKAKVTSVGVTARKGKVAVEVEVENANGDIMPGVELTITFGG